MDLIRIQASYGPWSKLSYAKNSFKTAHGILLKSSKNTWILPFFGLEKIQVKFKSNSSPARIHNFNSSLTVTWIPDRAIIPTWIPLETAKLPLNGVHIIRKG